MSKQAESEALKAVTKAYDKLSAVEQETFRLKLFSKLTYGLTQEQKKFFRKERADLIMRIGVARKEAEQLEAISKLSVEQIEEILATKKHAEASKKPSK